MAKKNKNEGYGYISTDELLEFTNSLSREIEIDKQSLKALYDSGIVNDQSEVVIIDGVISKSVTNFAEAVIHLEGREMTLNALAAFVLAKDAETRGGMDPSNA